MPVFSPPGEAFPTRGLFPLPGGYSKPHPCHFRLVTNRLFLNYLPIILGPICAEDFS